MIHGASVPEQQVQDKPGCMAVLRHAGPLPIRIEVRCRACQRFVIVDLPPGVASGAFCPQCFAAGVRA